MEMSLLWSQGTFLISPGVHTCSQPLSPPSPWLWPHSWTSPGFPFWQFYLQITEFLIFFLDQNFPWHPKEEPFSFQMTTAASKQTEPILIMETCLIFKKDDSIFSKKLTLSWGTAIVIFWLKHSTSISGFIFSFGFKITLSNTNWKWEERGSLLCCSFLFLYLPSPNTHYSVPFSKWGPPSPVCSWRLQVEINTPKGIFTWRLTPRKHSVSGKQWRMCLLQNT